jgi:photosystem II stability/assembly factor-like uncharacterized protein
MQRITRRLHVALPLLALPVAMSIAPAQGTGGSRAVNPSSNQLLSPFRFRNVGPASMGGRIDDIEVSESDPNIIYLGYAVGGVWKSDNHGVSYAPVFDEQTSASIGDIAIHPTNPNIVYVGTGEPNNRQSASFGDGVYKTTDGGKTWKNIGLKETQSIARIVIDPKNPEIVYVAAVGHLFGPNKERGLYKSTNGGATWTLVKYIDEDTGITDVALDPSNPSIVYAASYQRRRGTAWMNGGGPGSGVWKSENGGASWTKLTNFGIDKDMTLGRIALGVSRSNPSTVYVQIQAGPSNTVEATTGRGGRGAGGGAPVTPEVTPAGAAQRASDSAAAVRAGSTPQAAGQLAQTLAQFAGRGGGGRGGYDPGDNANVSACNNGAPNARPSTAPLNANEGGVFRSDNRGGSWRIVSNCNSRPMYFSQLRVDPTNPNTLYVGGLPWAKSTDGGKTFATLDEAGGNGEPGHVDQHAMWIDPRNPKHIMIGNDGGLNVTWDQGKNWDYVNNMTTSLAYWVSADMRRPYYVYTGLQDNGSWGGPSSKRSGDIYNTDWFGIGGGDGFQTAVNPDFPWIVYTESQDGSTNRYDLKEGTQRSIRPSAGGGGGGRGGGARSVLNASPGDQYRFNWNTPFMLSPHDANIVWLGGNRLFKSYNRGDTWIASEDLTKNIDRRTVSLMGIAGDRTMISKSDGIVHYSTIIAVNESPVQPGVVWVGTDDGNLQVSQDGGKTFTEVGKNISGLPANHRYWVARVEASHFDPATAYVAIDGHRSDDLKPYAYKTTDYGRTWTSVVGNLPASGNLQTIREDLKNPNLLFAGTEFGLYVSLDQGKTWDKMNDLPTVRTDEVLIHPRDGDLIVATHGRGIYIADDITALQQLTPAAQAADVVLFDIRPAVNYTRDMTGNAQTGGQRDWSAPSAPRGTAISYYLKNAAPGSVTLTITDACGGSQTLPATNKAGLNRIQYPAGGAGAGGRGGFGALQNLPNLTGAARDSAIAQLVASGGAQALGGFGGGFGGGRAGGGGAAPQGCNAGAAAAGRGGRGGGVSMTPGWYTAKLTVNGREYTKSFQVLEDKWSNDRWAIDR